MRRWIAVAMATLMLAGCGTSGDRRATLPPSVVAEKAAAAEPVNDPQKARQVNLDLIRTMLEKKQYYAALAYIEEQRGNGQDNDELALLEADARRNLGQQAQAEAIYRRLLGTRFEGQAYHGIGLLYVGSDLGAAITNLQKASQRLPTNVEIRGDLGYALMEAGRYTEAMPELSTAAELAPNQVKGRNNLVILMLLTGNDLAAARLAQQSGAGSDTMRGLREEAQQIRDRQAARSKTAG